MLNTVCEIDHCTGCNACVNKCSKGAIFIEDSGFALNACIDIDKCINCGICKKTCPNINEVYFHSPLEIIQGWTLSEKIRNNSSSGGFASTAILKCIEEGYSVFTCCFVDNELVYDKVKDSSDLVRFAGSKYVKSDTKNIYVNIRDELKAGNKVLFIGLPCHVAGLYAFLDNMYTERLISIDLICHGSPSQKIFKKMIGENGFEATNFGELSFRKHADFSTTFDNRKGFFYWSIPFLKGQIYTENCYLCKYARIERVSDITIGDAWGSNLGSQELMKGLSLILINSTKGKRLANSLNFQYKPIDKDVAVKSNGQLDHPSEKPDNRNAFINHYRLTNNYFQSIKITNKEKVFLAMVKNSVIWKIGRRIMRGHW